ncbi:hypothetical protein [Desulfonema magnum]|uniref:Uncharacterized protein n=1 Tax=Desulfonema magnum TaxID=45655 RepID=A0A975BQS0_9BACT|nr:hypothetical protein [Desulfonema magnum]QTA89977.1 Uncharacterized protein dnm_060360 [Desulfonema magnum]
MQKTASLYFCTPEAIFSLLCCKKPLRSIFALRKRFSACSAAKNRFALFLHSGSDFQPALLQKTASLYFLHSGKVLLCCKKPLRFIFALRKGSALLQKTASLYFLHSGKVLLCCKKPLRFIFALRKGSALLQKTASLYFLHSGKVLLCCKKPLRSIFALRKGSALLQKTASLYFCTPEAIFSLLCCKKPLRSIFALRKRFSACSAAKNRFALFLHSGSDLQPALLQKTASLYFCTPEAIFSLLCCKKPLRSIFALRKRSSACSAAKNRFALFLHSGSDFQPALLQKTASLYFCTPEAIFSLLCCKKPLRSIFALRKRFSACSAAKNRFALFLHSGSDLQPALLQKTASLYFCTPEAIFSLLCCKKPLRSIFALRKRSSACLLVR